MRLAPVFAVLLAILAWASAARAHDFEPGVLALVETDARAGRFDVRWTEPSDSEARGEPVQVIYPSGCTLEGTTLSCNAGLRGEIAFEGIRSRATKVVVSIRWTGGRSLETIVTRDHARVAIDPSPPSSFAAFVRLGIEHVALGLDHVAFVVGLFLIVGDARRRLVATITAFTIAHSVTLALAAFDVLTLPRAPVEATIAASVLLVAVESMDERESVTRSHPWAVALGFGLVHGLGFAGALGELGLPHAALPATLLAFNLGVEIAQLALVALLVVSARLLRRRGRIVLAYAIGTLGAFWLIDRTVAMFTIP